jgi:hypothetical protein
MRRSDYLLSEVPFHRCLQMLQVVVYFLASGAKTEETVQTAICIGRLRALSIWRLKLEGGKAKAVWYME